MRVTQYVGALPQDSTNFKEITGIPITTSGITFTAYLIYDIPGSLAWPAVADAMVGRPTQISPSAPVNPSAFMPPRTPAARREHRPRGTGGRTLQRGVPRPDRSPARAMDQSRILYQRPQRELRHGCQELRCTAPATAMWISQFFKNTPFTRSIRTQFRTEIFNLFNRTNLAPPAGTSAAASARAATPLGTTAALRVSVRASLSMFSWRSKFCSERDHAINQDHARRIRFGRLVPAGVGANARSL